MEKQSSLVYFNFVDWSLERQDVRDLGIIVDTSMKFNAHTNIVLDESPAQACLTL